MRHEGLKNIRSYELDEQEYAEIMEALESTRRELGRAALQSSEESEPDPTTWQNECLEAIRDKQEVILSSPTGSGKTRVFMEWAKEKPERPIYITAPIKALSNQRFRELKAQGLNVGLETGDIKSLPEDADIICCTQEIYTNKYVENENATLIVDEFHYIFENQERQRAYIDGIHGSKAKNVLLCSATLGNLSKVNQYVNKVSGRNFFTYENDQRLTSLEYGGEISSDDIRDALVVAFSARKCDYIAESLAESRSEKFDADYKAISKDPEQQYEMYLDYMERKADIDELGKEYDVKYISPDLYMGVAAYYGAMLPKEKLFIEKLFEEELIDTVVGTDALALGVNFPVEKVVFSELDKRSSGPISKNLFDQLAGRAGRLGYFDHGTIYYTNDFGNGAFLNDSLYNKMLNAKNEDVSIKLMPKYGDILSGKTTPEQEAEYIREYSETPNTIEYFDPEDGEYYKTAPYFETTDDIKDTIDRIMSYDFDFLGPSEVMASRRMFMTYYEKPFFDLSKEGRAKYQYYEDSPYNDMELADGPEVIYYSEYFYVDEEDVPLEHRDKAHYAYKIAEGAAEEMFGPQRDEEKDWSKVSVFCQQDEKTGLWRPFEFYGNCPEDEGEFLSYAELSAQHEKNTEKLRAEFKDNIASVYDDELTPNNNCFLFGNILAGATMQKLKFEYLGDYPSFRDLLQFRKYLRHLPRKYRQGLDLKGLDDEINARDWTALNLERGKIQIDDLKENVDGE